MEEEDFSKLSVEDACAHKVWKARLLGYETAIKQFEQIEDEKSSEWNKYVGLMKKFVVDSHALCQEKGLEAVLIFVENCGVAGRTTSDVVSGIVQKCLAAPKARTKELGAQVILMYIEIEKYELVVEELLKGTESKNPKVTAACVHVLAQALKEFGPKVISVSKILKRVPPLLEDRDKVVRQETRLLVVEVYHWLGQSIKPQLAAALKPNQLAEIEAEYEKVKDTPAKPSRLLRSQQVKKSAVSNGDKCDGGSGDATGGDGVVEETDPFEFLEPVDILNQLNKEFYTKLESKKWVERKDVLEELDKLLQASPKLENADYGELLRALKKVIQKDSNVVVVTFAVKCVTGLASGLKKKFNHQYAAFVMPALFEKFKEKKQTVVAALRDAVDAVYMTTSLELLQEDILTCLDNKNPSIKSETCEFLARCFSKSTPTILNKKLLKPLCKGLSTCLRDQDPNVRNNSALALGTAMKVVGEKAIGPFLVDVEAPCMKKVKECCDKAEIVVKPQPSSEKASKTEKKPDPAEKADTKHKVVNKSKPVRPLPATNKASTQVKLLSRESALNIAKAVIPKDIYDSILSDDCDDQLEGCKKLAEICNNIPVNDDIGQALITLISLHDFTTPGENLMVRMDLLKRIVERYPIPSEGIELILHDVSSHLNDSSSKKIVGEVLTAFAKRTSLTAVTKTILGTDDFSSSTNEDEENLIAEKLNWISSSIMNINVIDDPAYLFDLGRKATLHSNSNVRNAGLALIGTVHLKGGNADMQRSTPPEKVSQATPSSNRQESFVPVVENEPSPERVPEKAPDQAAPKVDIGSKITESLLSELTDKNWKVRAEAVAKLQTIISSAQSISGHLGDAAPLIAARIHDSNAKISGSAIALVESLAPAMGPSCKRYVNVFLPALMKAIGDQKVWIRSAVILCLNTWGDVMGYEKFFEGEIIADALKTGSPAVRVELWTWLSAKLPDIPPKSFPKEELSACLSVLYSNFEDRNADIRKNACEAAYGFMLHLGYNNMVQAVDNIKGSGSSARVIKEMLDKTRGNLPIVPLQKSKSGTSATSEKGSRTSTVKSTSNASAKSKKVSLPTSTSGQSLRGKRGEEEDLSPLLQVNNLKTQRVIDEQKLKILKWNFVTPRAEFIELLKELMYSANVNKVLVANMFHLDFRYHIRAIENLSEDLHENKEAMKCNLDLILRWMTLRFFDTNPSVLLKGLEYLNAVFTILIEDGYNMLDSEANGFIPYLILKAGDPKDTVRNSVRVLLKQIASIYPSSKQFYFLAEGVKSKNARQRSECLDQMAWLIETNGVSVCHPSASAAIREIAKHIGDRDHTVRNAALNCVVTAFYLEGEKIMKMIEKLSEKDMFLLEERIKRAAKQRPLNVVKPLINVDAVVKPLNEDSPGPIERESPTATSHFNESSVEPSSEHGDTHMNVTEAAIPQFLPSIPKTRPTSGAYGFDRAVVEDIEGGGPHFQAPKLVDIDLQFLKDSSHQSSFKPIQMPRMTPTLSNYSQPTAIKRELVNIASSDIEKAMSAVSRIDTIVLSDKRHHLIEFADQLVSQLVHLIIILNQSAHPEVVNCYNATFSLFMKLCNSKELCSQISEATLYKILEQFLLLLTEPRLDNKQNMFGRVVNNLIIRLLEQSNKTNVMCALFKILYSCVNNPKASNRFKDLVVKCLWKLNKAQPEWDSELDYVRVLTEFNTFLKDYPTSWWKNEEFDYPLRTVKTVLHSMVKIRGTEVRDIADRMPNVSRDSELYTYIKKVIKHLKGEEMQKDNAMRESREYNTTRESQPSRESRPAQGYHIPRESNVPLESREYHSFTVQKDSPTVPHRLTKEEQDELSGIFRMIGDVDETKQGMRRLFAFIKSHPEANVEPFLSKTNPQFQQYIKRGLQALEEKHFETPDLCHKDSTTHTETPVLKDTEIFTQEAEVLWTKLKTLKEKSGCQLEKKREEMTDRMKELPTAAIQSSTVPDIAHIESLKRRIEKIKSGSNL